MKKVILATVLGLGVSMAAENSSLVEEFAHCDASFLTALYNQSVDSNGLIRSEKDKIAWFAVPDRTNPDEASLFFKENVKDRHFDLIGYYDSVANLTDFDMGEYYFWGIYLDGTMAEVKKNLNAYDWKEEGNVYYTNAKRYNQATETWEDNPEAQYGLAPEDGLETMLALSEHEGKTILTCSLQGVIPANKLIKYRPDLFIKLK